MKNLKKIMVVLFAMLLAVTSLPVGTAYAAAPDHIVINQIYGGGGKGKTPFSNSFIELYNPTDSEISLSDYRITYSSNRENQDGKHAGSTWQSDGTVEVKELSLAGSIPAKCSYLIRCAAEDTSVAVVSLDQADMDWNQVIDNDQSVEVILYKGTDKIDAISTRTTDFQDIGEGSAPATTDISKQKSLRRTNFADTDNNVADFCLLVWNNIAEAEKEAFIAANRPRSLADGAWTEDTTGGSAEPQIVINEVESNGDVTDWVEIYNAGITPVDISGWYMLDNDPVKHAKDVTPVAEGTVLNPGEYYVFDQNIHFSFGLGNPDQATVFNKDGVKIAEYAWENHANGVYARIPDGTGEFQDVEVSTKGTANQGTEDEGNTEDPSVETIEWPGKGEITVFDKEPTFLEDASGLDFYNGQLYAVDNGTGKFWILDVAEDGTLSFAKGFENGKRVRFQKDAENPDAPGPDTEGITVDGNGFVYVASERDNNAKGVNYNTILKVDPNAEGYDLTALQEWDLTASLPQVSANMGIEAVEWVSYANVEGKLWDQNTKAAFDPALYPNAVAEGVFFVALEDNGHVYAYILNQDGSVVQIADIDSKLGGAMALDYDTYEDVLWVVADNGYGNRAAKVTLTGQETVKIVHVAPPSGLDVAKNNEGFAIADASYTKDGQRPVYRFEDGVKSGALKIGSLACDYKENTEDPENPGPSTEDPVKDPENTPDPGNSGANNSGAGSSAYGQAGQKEVPSQNDGTVRAAKTGDGADLNLWVLLSVGSFLIFCVAVMRMLKYR